MGQGTLHFKHALTTLMERSWLIDGYICKFLLLLVVFWIAFSAGTHCTNQVKLTRLQSWGWLLLFSCFQLIVIDFRRQRFASSAFDYSDYVTQLHLMMLARLLLLCGRAFEGRHLSYVASFGGHGHPNHHRLVHHLLHVACRLHVTQSVMKRDYLAF